MTQSTINQFKQRFEEIKKTDTTGHIKDVRMAALMTDLEVAFDIPIIGVERREAFKRAYPDVYGFYREVSLAREL